MTKAVELHNVTKVYVTKQKASLAVKDIQFFLQSGEFVSLVGPSGCGKSTLLSMIAGLISPTSGTVKIYGKPVKGASKETGYMLQQDYLFPWRTIMENCMIGLELQGNRNQESKEYVEHLLAEMGLYHVADHYPYQLSGGMKQRVALVRTLATKPDILLLDEPFSALDYQTKLQLEDLVWKTLKTHRKTALLVTHDISEAIAMSDRIWIMDRDPGTIKKEVHIPESMQNALPFKAREMSGFHHIFNDIWQEFESSGSRR